VGNGARQNLIARVRPRLAQVGIFVLGLLAGLLGHDLYGAVKARLFPTDPLVVALSVDPSEWSRFNPFRAERFDYVIPSEPAAITPPPSGAYYRRFEWARGQNGVDADTTHIRIVLQAPSDKAVLITAFVPVIQHRAPPMIGTHVACPVGGAETNARRLTVDLDRGLATLEDGERNMISPTMLKFARGESEAIDIVASAENGHYTWALELLLVVDGEQFTTLVPGGGKSFSTTGHRRARTMHWEQGSWRPGEGPPVSGLPVE
jgi:hypothetical protein